MLRSVRDSRSLTAFVAALCSHDAQTREEAPWALGLLGDRRAVTYLEPLRNDGDRAVREAVAEAPTRTPMRRI